jgi:hypothetical protein
MLMDVNMSGRYVTTMGAQELCTSHEQDIIDAETMEGVSPISIHITPRSQHGYFMDRACKCDHHNQ